MLSDRNGRRSVDHIEFKCGKVFWLDALDKWMYHRLETKLFSFLNVVESVPAVTTKSGNVLLLRYLFTVRH